MDFFRLVIKVPRVIPNENPRTNDNKCYYFCQYFGSHRFVFYYGGLSYEYDIATVYIEGSIQSD